MKTTIKCGHCKKPFSFSEGRYSIENPGPIEIKPINCPYCGKEVTVMSTNTWWNIDKWSMEAIKKYHKGKSK